MNASFNVDPLTRSVDVITAFKAEELIFGMMLEVEVDSKAVSL